MGLSLEQINWQRRHCIALGAMLAGAGISRTTPAATKERTILVLGDSLSAEYGLQRGTGWVALLEKRLVAEGITASVVNASISGDTTAGGRARLPALLAQHQPALLVIELGGNDALRGLSLDASQQNMDAMAQAARRAGARVLLLGMQVPPNYGRDYGQRFAGMYVDVARAQKTGLVPFFLKGVADVPDSQRWFQPDRIHPVEAAHPKLLANVWPELKKALQ